MSKRGDQEVDAGIAVAAEEAKRRAAEYKAAVCLSSCLDSFTLIASIIRRPHPSFLHLLVPASLSARHRPNTIAWLHWSVCEHSGPRTPSLPLPPHSCRIKAQHSPAQKAPRLHSSVSAPFARAMPSPTLPALSLKSRQKRLAKWPQAERLPSNASKSTSVVNARLHRTNPS
jgi:hypothetical protein